MENVASIDNFRVFKDVEIGRTEREVRVDLAACYRLVSVYGMTDLAANHITARVPGSGDHFFINPYGMLYDEITASSLHKIDLDGNIVERGHPDYGVNTAGYVIHSAIHAARHDVGCILHTHTRAGVAVSCLEEGLMPLHQTALQLHDQIAYHDFEGPVTAPDEKVRLVRDLGDKQLLILRNHGLLACGRTIAEAFFHAYLLDAACKIQVDVLAMGAPIHRPSGESVSATHDLMSNIRAVPRGNLEWASLRRRVDRLLPGYDQ
jgi:ribulose-5-phosphate 4-epimerase/fuculose-1-phosphate aldolase